jgi:head-tail adaptor
MARKNVTSYAPVEALGRCETALAEVVSALSDTEQVMGGDGESAHRTVRLAGIGYRDPDAIWRLHVVAMRLQSAANRLSKETGDLFDFYRYNVEPKGTPSEGRR